MKPNIPTQFQENPLIILGAIYRHRQTHTDTQTRRHADTQTRRHADTQPHSHTDAQTHRRTDAQAPRRTDAQTHRHTDTQTHRHTDTQTHRHTDTQTHRHTDTHTAILSYSWSPLQGTFQYNIMVLSLLSISGCSIKNTGCRFTQLWP